MEWKPRSGRPAGTRGRYYREGKLELKLRRPRIRERVAQIGGEPSWCELLKNAADREDSCPDAQRGWLGVSRAER
jgi:hypothetical protein